MVNNTFIPDICKDQNNLLQNVFTQQFCMVLWVISFKVNIHFSFNSLISSKPCAGEEENKSLMQGTTILLQKGKITRVITL